MGFFFEVAVGWLLVAWLVKRAVPDATRSYDVKWLSLLIVIATVLFSRLTAFEPGIVFGLVAGAQLQQPAWQTRRGPQKRQSI
ncbi:MAG: hypothetical protein R2709_06780 [Marmoricola sp.]